MYFTFLSGIKLKVLTIYFNIAEKIIMLIQGELDVSVFALTMIYYTKFTKKCAASYNCSLGEGRQSSTYCIHSCLCVSIWSFMPGTVRTMDPELGTTNTCTYRRDLAIVCGL